MKLRHAILLSGVCHLCLLGYAYAVAKTTVEEPELPMWFRSETAEFAQPQKMKSSAMAELKVEPKAAQGGSGAEGDAKSASEGEPEAEPESKPKPEPKPEPEPESVVAQEESNDAEAEGEPPEESSGEAVASAAETGSAGGEGSESGESGDSGEGSGDGDGSGEGVGAGDGPGGGQVDRGRLIRGYATSIYKVLAREQHYPRLARRAGLEGIVKVTVTIDEAGNILDVQLAESSGHKTLDEAALETVRRLERLPSPPEALAWKKKQLNIPLKYDLDRRG